MEWKRPPIPSRVKLQVLLNQDGRCKATGVRLGDIGNVHFDHRPPLFERPMNEAGTDTVPPANDPAYIEAITVEAHKVRTFGPGGEKRATTAGGDIHRKAKTKRLQSSHARQRQIQAAKAGQGEMPEKPPSKWGKRKVRP